MDLPLVYPCGDLKSVKVGIIKVQVVKMFCDNQLRITGDLPFHVLSSVCVGVTPEQLKEISIIDSNRILFAAWKQSHMADKYIAKVPCECGKTTLIKHNITSEYEKGEVYDKEHEFTAVDPDTLDAKVYKIKLRPIKLSAQINSMIAAIMSDEKEMPDEALWGFIESIDGKEDFDKDAVPISLYRKSAELNAEEEKKISKMTTIIQKCDKCEKELASVIGIYDAEFLQG